MLYQLTPLETQMTRLFISRALIVFFAILLTGSMHSSAQSPSPGYIKLVGSTLADSTGTPVANATITFAPVSNAGIPISFKVGAGFGAMGMAVLGTGGAAGTVASITPTAGGFQYSSSNPPQVQIAGGGGTGAVFAATVTGTAVTGFTQIAPGSGYTSAPTIAIIGGVAVTSPVSAVVTNGAFQIFVADTGLTTPANICYSVTVTDNVSGNALLGPGYNCVQPTGLGSAYTWCEGISAGYGALCVWDALPPNMSAQLLSALSIGTVTTLAPGSPATASLTPPSQINLGIPQGVAGSNGTNGSAGAAATIAVGTSTALAPGSTPTVTNSGSSAAAVFNFAIPSGATGPPATFTGVWSALTAYGSGSVVSYNGSAFAASVSNTNVTPPASCTSNGTWLPVSCAGSISGVTSINGQGLQSIGGSYSPSFNAPFFTQPGLTMFGDSISCDYGVQYHWEGYSGLIENAFGAPYTNLCRSGDWAEDTARVWVFPYYNAVHTQTPNVTVMIGTNNGNACGTSTGCEANYSHALQAIVSDIVIPNSYKTWGQSCTTTSGTTVADNTVPGVRALESTSNGTVITCTTTKGGTAVDVVWRAFSSAFTGTATVTIDGTSEGTLNAYGFNGVPISTSPNNTTDTLFANEYTVAAASSHTVVFTITSATSTSNPFSVVYVATPYQLFTTAQPPNLLLLAPVSPTGTTAAAYGALMQTIANEYIANGANVKFVNTPSFMNNSTDFAQNPTNISGITLSDIAATAGSESITSASANFGPKDVGKLLEIDGAGSSGGWLDSYVTAYVNQTTVTINTAAITTGTGLTTYFGTNEEVTGVNSGVPYYIHPVTSGMAHIRDAVLSVGQPEPNGMAYNGQNYGNTTFQAVTVNGPSPTSTSASPIVVQASGQSSYAPRAQINDTDATGVGASGEFALGYAPKLFMNGNGSQHTPFVWATINSAATPVFEVDPIGNVTTTTKISGYNFNTTLSPGSQQATNCGFAGLDSNATSQQTSWGTHPPYLCFNTHPALGYNILQVRNDGSTTDKYILSQSGAVFTASTETAAMHVTTPCTIPTGTAPVLTMTCGLQTTTLASNQSPTGTGAAIGGEMTFYVCNATTVYTLTLPAVFHNASPYAPSANTCVAQTFKSYTGTDWQGGSVITISTP
jgi:hypothetical protein